MTDFSTATPEVIANEVGEGMDAVVAFVALPAATKVAVVKHLLDAEIGSDEGARLKSLPGMTPEITEMVLCGISMVIQSPSFKSPIIPPAAASGET